MTINAGAYLRLMKMNISKRNESENKKILSRKIKSPCSSRKKTKNTFFFSFLLDDDDEGEIREGTTPKSIGHIFPM
jgi:hypothetical protein